MSTDFDFELERRGDWDELFFYLHRQNILGRHDRRNMLLEIIDRLANDSEAHMRISAAQMSESGYLSQHISQSPVIYRPGGAGGGGSYDKIVGVERGTSDHPLYVHNGTMNIYAGATSNIHASILDTGGAMQGRIYPKGVRRTAAAIDWAMRMGAAGQRNDPATAWARQQKTPVLTFKKKGEPRRFRQWVSGQAPKPFVYWAFRSAVIYNPVLSKPVLRTIMRRLFRPNAHTNL